MCGGVNPYQQCHVAGVYLNIVCVVLQDSWEGLHRGAVSFLPEGHGEGHHPPHTLIHLHPLQGCIDMRERESTRWTVKMELVTQIQGKLYKYVRLSEIDSPLNRFKWLRV